MSQDQIPVHSQPKKRGCRRGCLIVVLVLALPFWWFCIHPAPLRISEETTYVTGPVTSKGYIDYLAALEERNYPPEMKTDNNGYRLFVQQFGLLDPDLSPEDYEFYRLQTYEKLGLDPDIPTTHVFPDLPVKVFKDYYEAKREEIPERFFKTCIYYGKETNVSEDHWRQPWTLEEYPMLADWINEIDEPLNAIAEAVRKPIFFPPLLYTPQSVQPGIPTDIVDIRLLAIQELRNTAKIFQARAMYRAATDNIDGAIDDKLTVYRLGRQMTHKSFLVQYLVGIAIESMASTIPVNGSSEHQATKEQIQRVLDGFDALPPRGSLHDSFESERFIALSILQEIRHGRPLMDYLRIVKIVPAGHSTDNNDTDSERKSDPFDMILRAYIASCDWNVVYRRVHEMYDALQTLPPQEFEAMVKEIEHQVRWDLGLRFFTAKSRGTAFANMFGALFLPAVLASHEARRRTECVENMQRLTLALLLYEKEHGTLPDGDWREAVKPYLGENTEPYFRCPSHRVVDAEGKWRELEGTTTYAMVGSVPNPVPSPNQILLMEVCQPQKLGEGDGRIPFEKVRVWRKFRTLPPQDPPPSEFDGLGSYHPGIIPVGMRSGVVRLLPATIEQDKLHSLLDGSAKSLP